ncbi:uncharacterized protein LOC8265134 [Ricinus communis]|uniref:Oxidative stress 3 n=1 Tax=Ricinus communis TaxID=3988 RepID=B9RKG1_RICCO|nr:uncharacterized protein LOC8265134 [Ricinus communis]EEF48159.1 conserved hypothetical protein [Ricinus communis]|eukprot:XP_002514205.1 uncharacterized protein LOC8265134 [Ricinus communis]
MAEETQKIFLGLALQKIQHDQDHHWVAAVEDGDNVCESTSSGEYSMGEDSINSIVSRSSCCSTDLEEDASSSASSSASTLVSSHANDGPLYELSELMAQLPIKRGLSKFYKGKSQSYTSLASVKSIEDLAKKVRPYNSRSKLKSCKSYAVLDAHKSFSPKATISKKASRGSFLSSSGKRGCSLVADF